MISILFEHNQKAYEKASEMLEHGRRAAIVHPTGTGKSFIGFQFVIDHPDWSVCWLSPSEYIFSTQLENVRQVQPDFSIENLTFLTYVKLMNMELEELDLLHPSFIILDEFHRAGATFWQKGVRTLLRMYPEAMILGLSATNIRYLDNQRDMAEELFHGNIASYTTLGEGVYRKYRKYVIS